MSSNNPYMHNLDKNPANYVPLSPLTFMARAAHVHPNHPALIHGEQRYTWAESYVRARRIASALAARGITVGDTVSVLGFNTPETFELHFAVPMTGAVLHAINTRLDAKNIAFMLEHAETKILFSDRQASPIIGEALRLTANPPLVIDIDDPLAPSGDLLGSLTYNDMLAEGDPDYAWQLPADEWQAISLNYTSGTTGNPKGVVYHHRGAYLNAVSNALVWDIPNHPTYLWTLPMFHCNGWCFPWTIAAKAGTNVCLRQVDVNLIYELIAREQITHYCGAPIVHNLMAQASAELRAKKKHPVKGLVAGAPPPAAVLATMAENGFDITHVYGLTETYGPAVVCAWQEAWDNLPPAEQAQMKARQGVTYPMLEEVAVLDVLTMEPVPADGQTIGEVMMRGNIVMKGYLKNPDASERAFAGGWFHSGDLGVIHPDGYIELKDRSKDIIISGGENISSIEVEGAIFKHPAVMDAAVVGKADPKWGETPCAFVTLKEDAAPVTEAEVIQFLRSEIAHFKVPRFVIFGPLPKTSTGKTQKYVLRERAKDIESEQ